MGQKSNPIGLRLQINRTWDSRWYAEGGEYARLLEEDLKLRKYIMESLPQAAISKVVIERPAKLCRVSIYAARPGVIIGKKGADIEKLRAKLSKMTSSEVKLNIVEIRKPEIDAKLVAQGVADQLIRRVAFRRAMKRTVSMARKFGGEGIKVTCSGRLAGAEIARTEWYRDGRVPLQTLRADIDYGFAEAATTFGRIGVKVWIYKGEILSQALRTTPRTLDTSKPYQERRERRGNRRDGDRRGGFRRDGQNGGFNRDRQNGGFNRGPRPEGGFRKPAEKKEGGAQ